MATPERSPKQLTRSRRRLIPACALPAVLGIALIASGIASADLNGLLLIMAGVAPIGWAAANADVAEDCRRLLRWRRSEDSGKS